MDILTRYVLPGAAAVSAALAVFASLQDLSVVRLFAVVGTGVLLCAWAVARDTRWGIFAAALGGLAANAYLLSLKWAASDAPSLCSVSAVINCDKVNSSEYSMLLGLPVTLFGVAFYLGLALAALPKPGPGSRLAQITALFSLPALAFSVYLGMASYAIGAVCAVCLGIYAINVILAVAGFKGLRESGTAIAEELGKVLGSGPFLTVTAVFLVAMLVGKASWDGRGAPAEVRGTADRPLTPEERVAMLYAEPSGPVALDGTEPVFGDPNAPYVIVEFADFGCPHCAHASKDFKAMIPMNPDIQVRFKAFPLSGACNPLLEGSAGPERCVGALAAECAGRQGKFWPMSQTMFQNLGYLAIEDLTFMAGQVGVDLPTWEACLQDPEAQQSVLADVEAGIKAGVQGTPALFLKGTHGEKWVQVLYTPAEALQIVEAHRSGMTLPEPGPAPRR